MDIPTLTNKSETWDFTFTPGTIVATDPSIDGRSFELSWVRLTFSDPTVGTPLGPDESPWSIRVLGYPLTKSGQRYRGGVHEVYAIVGDDLEHRLIQAVGR
jgi:hypothetical protein